MRLERIAVPVEIVESMVWPLPQDQLIEFLLQQVLVNLCVTL